MISSQCLIAVFPDEAEAKRMHQRGLLRLFRFHLADLQKYLAANIPGFKRFSILYATRGNRDDLIGGIIEATFTAVLLEGEPDLRRQVDFEERLLLKSELYTSLCGIAALVEPVLAATIRIEKQLADGETEHNRATFDDIRGQLKRLIPPGFPANVPFRWLQQYPRYLNAIDYRLDKLQGNLERDRTAIATLERYWTQLDAIHHDKRAMYTTFRWMLEELRISMFAQAIGTNIPVSEKRLEKEWQKLKTGVGK